MKNQRLKVTLSDRYMIRLSYEAAYRELTVAGAAAALLREALDTRLPLYQQHGIPASAATTTPEADSE